MLEFPVSTQNPVITCFQLEQDSFCACQGGFSRECLKSRQREAVGSWGRHMRPLGSHPGETPRQHCLRLVNTREKVGEGLKAMLFSVQLGISLSSSLTYYCIKRIVWAIFSDVCLAERPLGRVSEGRDQPLFHLANKSVHLARSE